MPAGDQRHRVAVWPGPPTGVRELQADDQVVGAAGRPLVRLDEAPTQLRQRRDAGIVDHELARVGAPVWTHGDGLAAPHDPPASTTQQVRPGPG